MINLSAGGAALVGFVEGTSGGRIDLNLPGLPEDCGGRSSRPTRALRT